MATTTINELAGQVDAQFRRDIEARAEPPEGFVIDPTTGVERLMTPREYDDNYGFAWDSHESAWVVVDDDTLVYQQSLLTAWVRLRDKHAPVNHDDWVYAGPDYKRRKTDAERAEEQERRAEEQRLAEEKRVAEEQRLATRPQLAEYVRWKAEHPDALDDCVWHELDGVLEPVAREWLERDKQTFKRSTPKWRKKWSIPTLQQFLRSTGIRGLSRHGWKLVRDSYNERYAAHLTHGLWNIRTGTERQVEVKIWKGRLNAVYALRPRGTGKPTPKTIEELWRNGTLWTIGRKRPAHRPQQEIGEELNTARQLRADGLTWDAVAEVVGVPARTLRYRFRRETGTGN